MSLNVSNLSFERNEQLLFSDLHFELQPGELLQIKGMNGAGKTSLLRILCGLIHPTTGNIFWKQNNIYSEREAYLQDLIYVGHQLGIKGGLTVRENLRLWAVLQKCPLNRSIDETLIEVGLEQEHDQFAAHLSAGQKQRLALAKLWLLSATLWILDEPLTALDSSGTQKIIEKLLEHTGNFGMVIITSHQTLSLNNAKVKELAI